MPTDHDPDPLDLMIAHALQASAAPRFLISLFTLGPGEHRIAVDLPEVGEAGQDGAWLLVTGTGPGRRARLSFASRFDKENAAGLAMPTIWHHILIDDGALREAKTLEETLPERFDVEIEVRALSSESGIEDLCDACAWPTEAALRGQPPRPPLASDNDPSS